ncbi:MAG: tRNA pseudouridine(38-40) synthase TruA [Ignavibacteriales bacterium]|nr:tRNA pseudouridine(38-40) synthase TruA [Ignavibacteriales bacterium]
METFKLCIEYDGTNYVGWQIQSNGTSVQSVLEGALQQILQLPISTVAAGRTDAGVHARGQVVSFKCEKQIEPEMLTKSLNGVLPNDIVALTCERASEDFHARHSARSRMYRYYLSCLPTSIQRNFSWYVGGYKLDRKLLNDCAEIVLGEHDFTSFCKTVSTADHFLCTVHQSSWSETRSNLVYEIRANRFLHGMVRTIVGTMVEVARGHREFNSFREILASKDRANAGMAAPAKGLFLEEITY